MATPPAGVILAAGESRRMGSPKALLPYRGTTFLEHLACLLAGKVHPLLVVLGHDAERIRATVHLPSPSRVLTNPDYRLGQLSSLYTAIRSLQGTATPGLLVAPVDHPCIGPEVVDALRKVFDAEQPNVVVPTFEGRRGHPVVFAARLFPELLAAPLEEGARAVVRRHAVREVPVSDAGILADIDDPETYRRWAGSPISRVFGVDFSAAQDAGKRIWIATGIIQENSLRIETCFSVKSLLRAGPAREASLKALCSFIASQKTCLVGLDFPFGLPRGLVQAKNWLEFVKSFPEHYNQVNNSTEFRERLFRRAGKRELKRRTDEQAQTPFSPYNLRLYKQTFHGIRDVLRPLVEKNAACVLPMQKAILGKPWILEVCPASTLKKEKLYYQHRPYKKRSNEARTNRLKILQAIEKKFPLKFAAEELRQEIIEEARGDALDSLLAAFATFRNRYWDVSDFQAGYKLEGYVFI